MRIRWIREWQPTGKGSHQSISLSALHSRLANVPVSGCVCLFCAKVPPNKHVCAVVTLVWHIAINKNIDQYVFYINWYWHTPDHHVSFVPIHSFMHSAHDPYALPPTQDVTSHHIYFLGSSSLLSHLLVCVFFFLYASSLPSSGQTLPLCDAIFPTDTAVVNVVGMVFLSFPMHTHTHTHVPVFIVGIRQWSMRDISKYWKIDKLYLRCGW